MPGERLRVPVRGRHAKGRGALHQFSQTRQLPGRASVDGLPGRKGRGVEFEAVAVGEHPERGVVGVRHVARRDGSDPFGWR
jgi:hypothetical protein